MKKALLALPLALTMFLTACGGGETKTKGTEAKANTPETKQGSETSGEKPWEAALKEKPTGTPVVLVTNNGGAERIEFMTKKFKEKGFNVTVVDLGGAEVTARVIAEKDNPTTNVVWGPSNDLFSQMIDAGALAPFVPDWKEDVKGYGNENGFSWPYEIQPKIWVANPEQYNDSNVPKRVNDLWEKAEYHGKYTVPTKFGGATNRAIIGSILGQYMDESGELGVSEDGWKAIKAFFDYGVRTPEGEKDYKNMVDGKTPICYSYASGLYKLEKQFGPCRLIFFENGQPDNTNEVGVVKSSDPAVLAESYRLANYIGSAEFIGDFAAENGNIVVNSKAKDKMTPIAKEVIEKYKPQKLDWKKINALMDQWVAKIQLEIY